MIAIALFALVVLSVFSSFLLISCSSLSCLLLMSLFLSLDVIVDGSHGGGSEYTTGVTVTSTGLQVVVASGAPDLYHYCKNHSEMGFVNLSEPNPIRVATHPDYQGKGVGSFMINEIMNVHPAACAKVKLDNEASIKLFERCGFKKKYYLLEKDET